MRHRISRVAVLAVGVLLAACQNRSPLEPTPNATVDQLIAALRQQGLSVSPAGQIPADLSVFSVPAQQLAISQPPVDPVEARIHLFEYPTREAAAREAALVSADGQPGPTIRVTWVSTPRFYRQDRFIVLYVGCSPDVVRALQGAIGSPFVTGATPCRLAT
jgi:hypothetical protein